MAKWLIGLLVLVAASTGAWYFYSTNGGAKVENKYLSHIPADSVFYFGGQTDSELQAFMASYSFNMMPSQTAMFSKLLQEMPGAESPQYLFFNSLFEQVSANTDGSVGSIQQALGGASDGHFVFYTHGAVPVIRLEMADTSKLLGYVEQAVKDSAWNYQESTVGQASVKQWELTPEESPLPVSLALAVAGNDLTLTFISSKDTADIVEERLAQRAPDASLSDSGAIAQLQKTYGFNGLADFVFNIEEFGKGLLQQNGNRLSKDLDRFLSERERGRMLNEECNADAIQLAASVPRLVFGYTDADIKGDRLEGRYEMILEMKNENVKNAFMKMRGHLPEYTLDASDKLIGFSVGFNTDGLMPALTSLWSQFTTAKFSCDTLVQAQQELKSQSPAVALGMLGGVNSLPSFSGIGLALYDVAVSEQMMPETLAFLFSVATKDPQTLVALKGFLPVPQLQTLEIPNDGTPVALELPMLPPSIKPYVAIKGQHLVMYAGDVAAKAANKLASENIDPNGYYGVSASYQKIGELIKREMRDMPLDDAACHMKYEMQHYLSPLQAEISAAVDMDENGLVGRSSMSMSKPTQQAIQDLNGEYTVATYTYNNCQPVVDGKETFNADGTGFANSKHESGACDIWQTEYQWKQVGSTLEFTPTKDLYRESCEEEFETNEEVEPFKCAIMNVDKDSFQCLYGIYNPYDEPYLVEYRR